VGETLVEVTEKKLNLTPGSFIATGGVEVFLEIGAEGVVSLLRQMWRGKTWSSYSMVYRGRSLVPAKSAGL